MSSPIARLKSLSEEEKSKLSAVLRRKLFLRVGIFSSIVLVCLVVMMYFNTFSGSYKVEDNLEIINVVFVVISVLCLRLVISEILEFGKETRSPNKKVIHTRIAGRKGDEIILGNKSFSKSEILLDNSEFDSFKGGEDVVLELSAISNSIFSVKRIVR